MPKKITDIGTIYQRSYSDDAHALRVAQTGLAFAPLGAINAAKRVASYSPIMCYNSDSTVHFVKFSDDGSAPASAADGLPVPPGQVVVFNSGAYSQVCSDSALVFGYSADQGE